MYDLKVTKTLIICAAMLKERCPMAACSVKYDTQMTDMSPLYTIKAKIMTEESILKVFTVFSHFFRLKSKCFEVTALFQTVEPSLEMLSLQGTSILRKMFWTTAMK